MKLFWSSGLLEIGENTFFFADFSIGKDFLEKKEFIFYDRIEPISPITPFYICPVNMCGFRVGAPPPQKKINSHCKITENRTLTPSPFENFSGSEREKRSLHI